MSILRILSAAAITCGIVAATAIALADKEERKTEKEDREGENEMEKMAEAEPAAERDQFGVVIKPNTIALELPEAHRKIELSADGELRFYEDDKVLSTKMMSNWPKGNYGIHYYRTFNRTGTDIKAGNYIYLFFKNLGGNGTSWFFKSKFGEPGYHQMDYVMVLDGSSLEQIPLSFTGKSKGEVKNEPFVLGSKDGPSGTFGGKQLVLYVPGTVYAGDTMGTVKSFAYVGQDDGRVYLCEIEKGQASLHLVPEEDWASYDIVGGALIADCGESYMVYYFEVAPYGERKFFYKDKFGTHDYSRFKATCLRDSAHPASKDAIGDSFYERINPAAEK